MSEHPLKIIRAHPLSMLMILASFWILFRKLVADMALFDDPYGPSFIGDFFAYNLQTVGYAFARVVGLPIDDSWPTTIVAIAVSLLFATAIEWGARRLIRRLSR